MAECGIGADCPGLSVAQEEAKKMSRRLMMVDLIREITRNVIGIFAVGSILWMLYQFVVTSPVDDRMNVMLLVIGYLGGLVTGITTYYFGGAMRSAVAAALQQAKGGTSNVTETSETTLGSNFAPTVADRLRRATNDTDPATGQSSITIPQDPADQQGSVRHDLQDTSSTGQSGQTIGGGERQSDPVG